MQNPAISIIADDETLVTFCERALTIYPGKIITIVVLGLEKYFRCVLMYSSSFNVLWLLLYQCFLLSFDAVSPSFSLIGQGLTSWPVNNCVQIMVRSRVLSKCVLLQAILCSCVIVTICCVKNGRSLPRAVRLREWFKYENRLGNRMKKQALNSFIAIYRDLSSARHWKITM